MKRMIACVLLATFATGCAASTARIGVWPMQGQDARQTSQDRAECEQQAQGITGSSTAAEAGVGAAVGMGLGALVGAALGAIAGSFFGLAGEGAAFGAAIGGFTGGVGGAGSGAETNRQVYLANYRGCMHSRHYQLGM